MYSTNTRHDCSGKTQKAVVVSGDVSEVLIHYSPSDFTACVLHVSHITNCFYWFRFSFMMKLYHALAALLVVSRAGSQPCW